MKETYQKLLYKVKYIRKRIPVRLAFFIILLFVLLVRNYVNAGGSDRVHDVARLLLKASVFGLLMILLFSIATLLVSYLVYIKRGAKPEIKLLYSDDNSIYCEINCSNILFPLAGVIKAEIICEKQYCTQLVLKRVKGRKATGHKQMGLPDIRNYKLESATIFFQDFFRLFSFQKTFAYNANVSVLPIAKENIHLRSNPFSLETDKTRTDTVHHKEGEMLHFKSFESSDDVRRIVWPIYAKTKELIIRKVEMYNMYASKIDMSALFTNNYSDILEQNVSNTFLNSYKNAIWGVYKTLKASNDVNFVPDQKIKVTTELQGDVSAHISGMTWHSDKIEEEKNISVCCITSLIKAEDIEKFVENTGGKTFIVFVSLKSHINKINYKELLKEIFTITKDGVNWKWLLSINRLKIMSNDNAIRSVLNSQNVDYIEL